MGLYLRRSVNVLGIWIALLGAESVYGWPPPLLFWIHLYWCIIFNNIFTCLVESKVVKEEVGCSTAILCLYNLTEYYLCFRYLKSHWARDGGRSWSWSWRWVWPRCSIWYLAAQDFRSREDEKIKFCNWYKSLYWFFI